jgi:glutamate-ammonia-ligase adenylyltransferase
VRGPDLPLLEAAAQKGLRPFSEAQRALVEPLLSAAAPESWLSEEPRLVSWLSRTPFLEVEKPALVFERELRARTRAIGTGETETFDRVLRLYRRREMARIALRDLTRRAPVRTIVRELSHLADTLVGAAVLFWDHTLAARFGALLGEQFVVIAMGKHGAQELNYSSDIDVLFVLEADAPLSGGRTRRDQAISVARGLIKSLSSPTEHGHAFRVDANLRPYGRDGLLVQTMEEMERYYERAGKTWERAALIKARACAGGIDVGRTLLTRLTPFIYRRTLDFDAVRAVAAMKRQIDLEQTEQNDVKLGRGGIREVEFFVQALQLLHGGRQPRLRLRATLDSLDSLMHAGVISAHDRDVLADGYVFLRDTEHRLQLPSDRQTHELPDQSDIAGRRALAQRMGFDETADFDVALANHRHAIRSRFELLLSTAEDSLPVSATAELAVASHRPEEARSRALVQLGFQDASTALRELRRLASQADGAFGVRGLERDHGLAGRLLDEMARSPDPDLALANFVRLVTPLWDPAAITSLLAANPATARLLMLMLASSEALTRDFQLHPDLLEVLVRAHTDSTERQREELTSEISVRLEQGLPVEVALSRLRQLRREETLRIGLQDLAGRLDTFTAGHQLTVLAEELLKHALLLAREEVAERFGEPEAAALAVLGLGSLGGAELDYESDLDLVFIHDVQGSTSGGSRGSIDGEEWAARVSQRLVSFLTMPSAEGLLYKVDARLRPSGTQGPLVTSLASFARYHGVTEGSAARGGELWERQALLRARPLAGDVALGERIVNEVLLPAMLLPLPAETGALIRDMRLRLDDVGAHGALSVKKSPGGLLDIDFTVQFLQLRHRLREPSTRASLLYLSALGLVDDELIQSHVLLRRLESRLRLMSGRSDVMLPHESEQLARLARQLGDIGAGAAQRLWGEVTRTMTRTRALFEAVFASTSGSC